MNKIILLILLLIISIDIQAQAPRKFNYQAVIRSNAGSIVANQAVSIRFSIHDATANGAVQYSERHTATTNAFGLVNLQVGLGTIVSGAFTDITWGSAAKFLQVEADITGGTAYISLATMELVSVPYAMQAEKAGSFTGSLAGEISGTQAATVIGNNTITTGKIADNAVVAAKLADNAVTTGKLVDNAVTTAKLADNNIITGKVADFAITGAKLADDAVSTAKIADLAIGTSKLADNGVTAAKIAPGAAVKSFNGLKDDIVLVAGTGAHLAYAGNTVTLSATGSGDITDVNAGNGLLGGTTAGTATLSANYGGNGTAISLSRSDHTHVGQTWSTAANVDILTLSNTSATASALNAYSNGTDYNAAAVRAMLSATTGQAVGVFGNTNSTDQYGAAIYGQAAGNGGAKALWGYGIGDNTFALYAHGAGANSWAGFFQGRVHVNGTLSKSAGSFKIDHPLDPMNKFLSHSFVESPDMMNVYNGNILLDAKGEAIITLPDYFEALNKDFRYQLTAIGKPSPGIYIAQEISGNRFRIAGGAPNGKISWQVTGIRHDSYANENRIPVVEEKPVAEKGTLLNPGNKNLKKQAPRPRGLDMNTTPAQ